MSSTKYVTSCTPFHLFPTCKSASVGAVLRDVKFILIFYVGIYTGHLCCIFVTLPDEVCVCHTKRVGQNNLFYNCKSSQTCCSLVLSKKILWHCSLFTNPHPLGAAKSTKRFQCPTISGMILYQIPYYSLVIPTLFRGGGGGVRVFVDSCIIVWLLFWILQSQHDNHLGLLLLYIYEN